MEVTISTRRSVTLTRWCRIDWILDAIRSMIGTNNTKTTRPTIVVGPMIVNKQIITKVIDNGMLQIKWASCVTSNSFSSQIGTIK